MVHLQLFPTFSLVSGQLDRGHDERTNIESQPEPEPRADRASSRKGPAPNGRAGRRQQQPQHAVAAPTASAASIAGTSCKSSSSASMPLANHGHKSFPRQPQPSQPSQPSRSSSVQATPPRKMRAESSETMPETPHSASSTWGRKASPTSSSSRFDRVSLGSSEGKPAPVQLRAWLERARQEASALYTSGALNGLRSPDRGRSRRSLSPGSTQHLQHLHVESGSISVAGEEIVDPRVEMFAHPRSLSPSVRECTIRGSAVRDPGFSAQRAAPFTSVQRQAMSQLARQSASQPRASSSRDFRPSSFGESPLAPDTEQTNPSEFSQGPERPQAALGQPFQDQHVEMAERTQTREPTQEEAQELVAEPVTRSGIQAGRPLTEDACCRHEELLQNQLLTTQAQLEDLQRQYLEVKLG